MGTLFFFGNRNLSRNDSLHWSGNTCCFCSLLEGNLELYSRKIQTIEGNRNSVGGKKRTLTICQFEYGHL